MLVLTKFQKYKIRAPVPHLGERRGTFFRAHRQFFGERWMQFWPPTKKFRRPKKRPHDPKKKSLWSEKKSLLPRVLLLQPLPELTAGAPSPT